MQQLEVGVLAVCAGFAIYESARVYSDIETYSTLGHRLTVRFHIELLEVGRESEESLLIR